MEATQAGTTRREALITAAKLTGAAAFAAPVVMSVFAAPAIGQTPSCNPGTNSRAVPAIFAGGEIWNSNCAGGGRYNGQNSNFTVGGNTGVIQVGGPGTDNRDFTCAYYTLVQPTGYTCSVTWGLNNCVAPNTTLANREKNRRIYVILDLIP